MSAKSTAIVTSMILSVAAEAAKLDAEDVKAGKLKFNQDQVAYMLDGAAMLLETAIQTINDLVAE